MGRRIKKSDMNKGWMKFRNDPGRKIRPERHLIISEGTATEPHYFGSIRNIINRTYGERIQIEVIGTGRNTISLFKKTLNIVRRSADTYRHVWIIYDRDAFPADKFDEVETLCRKHSNRETEFHAIWSNQCIELWYLLHFALVTSNLEIKEYFSKLDSCLYGAGLGNYTKNRKDMYQILRPYMDKAIHIARRLDKSYGNIPPSLKAPDAKAYVLVEKLRPYL